MTMPPPPPPASRASALARAAAHFASGALRDDLARRVAHRTESQRPGNGPAQRAYLDAEIAPALAAMGFATRLVANPVQPDCPFLLARRDEDGAAPTALIYGHGDVVLGMEGRWREGRDPWRLEVAGERWHGRGTADNKGQHAINLAALRQVFEARGGRLGFNCAVIIETGEEAGSPGLREVCRAERAALAADVLIASDGPRLTAERPTLFLGSRGAANFDLVCDLREGAHHSGNWGGLLANPGTSLANAIASMVDARGRILVEALRPPPIPDAVRAALADLKVGGGPSDPAIDRDWGEPGLTPEERVFGWNALEVLAFGCGDPEAPLNAVPARAKATLQLRFVVGTQADSIVPAVAAHLAGAGFSTVKVEASRMETFPATRLDPDSPWVRFALDSLQRTTGKKPALLPNLGGSIPNDAFSDILGLPTLWIPHSYPACSQHAPDEHLLAPLAEEGLAMMTGLFWDLGEDGAGIARRAQGG